MTEPVFANDKVADQPVHLSSFIGTFVQQQISKDRLSHDTSHRLHSEEEISAYLMIRDNFAIFLCCGCLLESPR